MWSEVFILTYVSNTRTWLDHITHCLRRFSYIGFYFHEETHSSVKLKILELTSHCEVYLEVGAETASHSYSTPSSTIREGRTGRLPWHQVQKQWGNGDPRHQDYHQWILNEDPRVTHSYRDEKNRSAATVWWWVSYMSSSVKNLSHYVFVVKHCVSMCVFICEGFIYLFLVLDILKIGQWIILCSGLCFCD